MLAVGKKVKKTPVSQQATSAHTIQEEIKSTEPTKSLRYHPTRQKSKGTCGITHLRLWGRSKLLMNGISRAQAFHGPSRPTALLSFKTPKMTGYKGDRKSPSRSDLEDGRTK
jgi:hypothetical protein